MTTYERVKEFHEKFEIPEGSPENPEVVKLRMTLIFEEFREVLSAFGYLLYTDMDGHIKIGPTKIGATVDKENAIKELADLSYVVTGTAVQFGWDFETAEQRVHDSNMSKLGENGKPVRRDDGKVLKGPNYVPAYLGDLV